MIKRVGKNLSVLTAEVPSGSVQLERDGYTVLRDVLTRDEIDAIAAEIDDAFERYPAERGREDKDEFRYEMLNRGAASQAAVGHDRILEVIEPLLGNDCHVIANTAWRNPPTSAADRGTATPVRTCRDPRASSGTTASPTRSSRSARTCC